MRRWWAAYGLIGGICIWGTYFGILGVTFYELYDIMQNKSVAMSDQLAQQLFDISEEQMHKIAQQAKKNHEIKMQLKEQRKQRKIALKQQLKQQKKVQKHQYI